MIEEYNLADKIELKATFCLGKCSDQVSVKIDEEDVCSVSGAAARKFFKDEVMHRLED
jgi:NADH:ubiquinone oxidoreductase subunit E